MANALSGPVATVLTAIVVGRLTLKGFRYQKTIEKRLEWYERVHRLIEQLAQEYGRIGLLLQRGEQVEAKRRVDDDLFPITRALTAESDASWLYATNSGFHAIQRLNGDIHQLISGANGTGGFSPETCDKVVDLCAKAGIALSADIRREMGIQKLLPPPRSRPPESGAAPKRAI